MLIRAIKYQLKYRIIKNFRVWVIFPVALFVFAMGFVQACTNYCDVTGNIINPCAGDFLLWILKGMKSARFSDAFYIPDGMWIAYYGILFYVTGICTMDMGRFENRIMTGMERKSIWWFSKCISCVTMVALSQLMVIVAAYIIGMLYGNIQIVPQDEVMRVVAGIAVGKCIDEKKVFSMCCAVGMTCVAIALLQLVISLVIGQITAIMVTMILLAFSVYVENPLFMGNNLMLMRYDEYIGSIGTEISSRLWMAVVVAIMCVLAGTIIVKKKSFVTEKR